MPSNHSLNDRLQRAQGSCSCAHVALLPCAHLEQSKPTLVALHSNSASHTQPRQDSKQLAEQQVEVSSKATGTGGCLKVGLQGGVKEVTGPGKERVAGRRSHGQNG